MLASLAWPAASALAFTSEQAAAGRAAYEQNCAACHGATLRQLPNALLGGTEFLGRWGNRATSDLIAQARSTMPPDNPGGLPAEAYTNIVAYLLQANGGAARRRSMARRSASSQARPARTWTGSTREYLVRSCARSTAESSPPENSTAEDAIRLTLQ